MKGIRLVSILLLVGLFVVSFGLPRVMAFGTGTASATAAGGENCAQAGNNRGSGGLTVVQVKVNGKPLDKSKGEYSVERDGSSQVIVKFTNPLSAGPPADKVEITYTTGNRGTHHVNITLKKC